ncbi:voltage-dependent anion channel [Phellopilus nigrolimitatus]|nr:voltage-dependent anion channel [Phellopilus nigrolimitatus]
MGTCDCKNKKPLRERIRHFTPAWHAVNMGTGAISTLFHVFPYGSESRGMQTVAFFFLLLNLIFFVVLTLCGVARYTIFRGIWSSMIRHPVQSLYLGCFPMGFATILMSSVGIVYTYFGYGGDRFLYGLWGLWWIDVALSLVICFGQLHVMFTRQNHDISMMTMVWLLPIVTLIVASSTGAVIAQAMIPFDTARACLTLAVCMALVTVGITLAFAVFTIYLHRLIVHGLPEGITIFSAFLPLGPLGQSGYAFLLLGEICRDLFPLKGDAVANIFVHEMTPHIMYVMAWTIAFALWSFATCWLLLALLALGDTLLKNTLPFKITFWGMIFPNGVYANLTIQLAGTIDSRILRVWGAIYAVFTLLLWLFATSRTLPSVWDGSIFEAPCLAAKPEQAELMGEDPARSSIASREALRTPVRTPCALGEGTMAAVQEKLPVG